MSGAVDVVSWERCGKCGAYVEVGGVCGICNNPCAPANITYTRQGGVVALPSLQEQIDKLAERLDKLEKT